MRRAFEHPWAPALGWGILGVVYMLAQPATADMAAHSYRAWLFQHEGLTVWNAQWNGGHHVLGYSLLFALLAAHAGPALAGAETAGALASWLFAAGVLSNVAIGRMPFLLGVALAIGAWWCESRGPGVHWRIAAVLLRRGRLVGG